MMVTPRGGGSIAPSLLGAARGDSWWPQRVDLLDCMQEFEQAVAVPTDDPHWRERVGLRLARLREALAEHIAVTEGESGLYAELLLAAPRLARAVHVLVRDHTMLGRALATFADRIGEPELDPARLRDWAGELLRELSRHRQRGAELIYEAYATDIGGET